MSLEKNSAPVSVVSHVGLLLGIACWRFLTLYLSVDALMAAGGLVMRWKDHLCHHHRQNWLPLESLPADLHRYHKNSCRGCHNYHNGVVGMVTANEVFFGVVLLILLSCFINGAAYYFFLFLFFLILLFLHYQPTSASRCCAGFLMLILLFSWNNTETDLVKRSDVRSNPKSTPILA